MKKTQYAKVQKQYYDKYRSQGKIGYNVFGDKKLIEATKKFVKQYKQDNGMYVYNVKTNE